MAKSSAAAAPKSNGMRTKNAVMVGFTLPVLLLDVCFFLVVMVLGIYYSMTNWTGISQSFDFIGLKNYATVLQDEHFWTAIWFNIRYTIMLVIGGKLLKILSYMFLLAGALAILFPFYITIITEMKTQQQSAENFFPSPRVFQLKLQIGISEGGVFQLLQKLRGNHGLRSRADFRAPPHGGLRHFPKFSQGLFQNHLLCDSVRDLRPLSGHHDSAGKIFGYAAPEQPARPHRHVCHAGVLSVGISAHKLHPFGAAGP